MDFKSLISKITSLDTPIQHVQTPAPAAKVVLEEGAQMRVLAGVSTILAESAIMEKKLTSAEKNKKEEVVKSMKKDKEGFVKRYGKKGEEVMHATATKIAKKKVESTEALDTEDDLAEVFDADAKVGDKKKTSSGVATKTATGMKHERTYGKDVDAEDDDKPKKKVKEASEKTATTWTDKSGKKHPATKVKGDKYTGKEAEKEDKKAVKEAAKPDFLDMDKDGDKKEPMKKAVADKKAGPKKGVNPFAKKSVKESSDRLTFKQCLAVLKESQGELQIDPVDKTLWDWANRVGKSKFNESVQAQAFAAATYEKMGGEWNLRKTLAE